MMYRRNIAPSQRHSLAKGRTAGLLGIVALLLVAGTSLAFHIARQGNLSALETSLHGCRSVERRRLLRSEIPPLNVHTMVYAELFNDTNATQLEAAIRNGIRNLELPDDPRNSKDLVPVENCILYVVDTMKYSIPYLVPEAKLLLLHIATRFQEVMQEDYPGHHHTYRLVVTSCYRTQDHVDLLRRHNRNATENSCHCYGTTLDISHIRWLDENDVYVNELFLKQELAKALYELRYEGLCWVKYECRQACFHITVNNTEYHGNKPSEPKSYAWDGARHSRCHGKHGTPAASECGGNAPENRQPQMSTAPRVQKTPKAQGTTDTPAATTTHQASKKSPSQTRKKTRQDYLDMISI